MSGEPWQTFGNIVNTAGLAGFAITGAKSVLAGYQTYASPHASLAQSERKLERVRSRLQELSPQQRQEIDSRCRASNSKCLKDFEDDLRLLLDTYYRLSKGCDEITFVERHTPYSEFRQHLRKLGHDTKGLFNDILTTTVPHVDDMGFDSRLVTDRSSDSESSITFPTPSIVVDGIPLSHVV